MTGLECQHLFCVSCWDQYLRVMVINEGKGEVSDSIMDELHVYEAVNIFRLLVVRYQTVA